ncbi:MAG: hypothetical protein H7831_07140 [Magnetococcus sp. WYHC-3]
MTRVPTLIEKRSLLNQHLEIPVRRSLNGEESRVVKRSLRNQSPVRRERRSWETETTATTRTSLQSARMLETFPRPVGRRSMGRKRPQETLESSRESSLLKPLEGLPARVNALGAMTASLPLLAVEWLRGVTAREETTRLPQDLFGDREIFPGLEPPLEEMEETGNPSLGSSATILETGPALPEPQRPALRQERETSSPLMEESPEPSRLSGLWNRLQDMMSPQMQSSVEELPPPPPNPVTEQWRRLREVMWPGTLPPLAPEGRRQEPDLF